VRLKRKHSLLWVGPKKAIYNSSARSSIIEDSKKKEMHDKQECWDRGTTILTTMQEREQLNHEI
jgi:hypothetical protein